MPLPHNFILLPALAEIVNRSPLTVHPDLLISEALALMSQSQGSHCELLADGDHPEIEVPGYIYHHSCVLITEGRELRGILTERDIVRMTAQERDLTSTRVGEVMTHRLITLTQAPNQTALTVLPLFHQHRIRHLPIIDEFGHLVGIITPDLLRRILKPANLLKLRSIAEVMTKTVIQAAATATILSIAKQMATNRVSCVVITARIPAELNESVMLLPIGIITERDIVQFQTLGIDLDRTTADTVMSSPVFCLQPEDSLWRAQQEMNARLINRLVVTNLDGQMLGIITQTSLLQPLDPLEVFGMVDVLHQQVQVQTAALEQTNQELRQAIDRQHQAEAELRLANDQLAQVVTERTGELWQCDIQQRQVKGTLQDTLRSLEFQKYDLDRSAMLLNIATDAIMVRDLNNRLRFWSDGAERIYGWSASEVIDQNVLELLYQDASPAIIAFNTVLKQGEWQGELEKITKTGQIVVVYSRWTLVRDEESNPKEILNVDTDITEKKQLEAQFLRAQRLESLGTLASGIAHDMNNVLTPILAASQLLPMRLKEIDDRSQSLLRMLEESARRGTDLVQQILSFARGSDGTRTPVQIRHTLSEVVKVARQTFPKSIEISLNLATTDLLPICADATQLHQVLMNLTINARDAMPNGGNLTLAAENLILDGTSAGMNIDARIGPYVLVTVADTGTGIPPKILAQIFDPFFTTKAPGKGTGLGLSTTLSIVKSHGGFVTTHSEVGRGTQFQIYLPAAANPEAETTPGSLDLPLGNGELVLVVDDEVSVREIIRASLEAYNYQVVTASDGIEAIAIYAQYQAEIEIVLLDLMMPSLDSASTIHALQEIDGDVSIVVMSGLSATDPIVDAINLKAQAFLAKPFTTQELLQTLSKLSNYLNITDSN